MNNETMQLLYNRKSVRAYEKQPIPEADVQAILRAAVEAPTAGPRCLCIPNQRSPQNDRLRLVN